MMKLCSEFFYKLHRSAYLQQIETFLYEYVLYIVYVIFCRIIFNLDNMDGGVKAKKLRKLSILF